MQAIIDLEANGLVEVATQLWCAVAYVPAEDKYYEFDLHEKDYREFQKFMQGVSSWIGHNIIRFDIPLLSELNIFSYNGYICDTLVASRLLNPERKRPDGCPTHLWDEVNQKYKPIGGHGLEAWGWKHGVHKPHVDRWDKWDSHMLHRCKEDVKINYLTYLDLCEEAELDDLPLVKL